MGNIKTILKEKIRLFIYFMAKLGLTIVEEVVSFLTRIPKILGCSVALFSIISFLSIVKQGIIMEGLRIALLGFLLSILVYFISVLLLKPFNEFIFDKLETIREINHNINCGIYMEKYKIRTIKENSLDNMLNLKELLETNILLSGLKLKEKLISDDNYNLTYETILSNGLQMGNALCFSPDTKIENTQNAKEFVIENDAFIKEFDKFCNENSDAIDKQIKFLKQNKKRIMKNIS